nr:RuBisCO long chain, Form III-b [uncultured bacterium]
MTEVEWNYLKIGYKPRDDVVCLFRIEPGENLTLKEAAETVALESSTGTWTKIPGREYVNKLNAKVFSIKGNFVKIAYPSALFERGNAPNILSSIAGNIFGMKAVRNLRLEDVSFPKNLVKSFPGPYYGIEGIRKLLKVYNRPLLGTIIKPKLGLPPKEHALSAYNSWRGGLDLVKCDENLVSQDFNRFEERLSKTLEMKDKAEEETGERKGYLENVTAETNEMIRRAELIKSLGGKFCMVDILTEGWGAIQTLREANFKIAIHGHRASHATMTRNPKHGIRMIVLADFARLIGVDSLHIGTGIGKLEGDIKDVYELAEEIEKDRVEETKLRLKQDWYGKKPVLAVCSGGLTPLHFPYLIRHLGKDIILQCGGGIHGNKLGTISGAKAARQAVDATMQGIGLKEYAKTHSELKSTIEQWG